MGDIERCEHDNAPDVCPACENNALRETGARLADMAERLLDERDDARGQLRGAVDLVRDLLEHVEATDVKRPESMGPLKVAVRARDFLARLGGP